MQKVPRIVSQSERYLQLAVPSKSRPGEVQIVEYKPNGDRECSCPGAYWFREKGQDLYKSCRHQNMTTIRNMYSHTRQPGLFDNIRLMAASKKVPLYTIWAMMGCAYPKHRNETGIHCNDCPLYPKVCNIHKIKTGRGPRARLPLIWKLQEACYNNKRAEARKIINKIILAIKKHEG